MMERPPSPRTPIEARYAFDLDDVTPRPAAARRAPREALSPEDRAALGLHEGPDFAHHAPEIPGDAATALRDLLAKGGALGKSDRKR